MKVKEERKVVVMLLFLFVSTMVFCQGVLFSKLSWVDVLTTAKRTNKPIFVDVYTSWCSPCKQMDREVFTNAEVGKVYNDNFICFKVNGELGIGADIALQYNVSAFPAYLFIKPDGSLFFKSFGFQSVNAFITTAQSAMNEFHNTKTLISLNEEYMQNKTDTAFMLKYIKRLANKGNPMLKYFDEYLGLLPPTDRLSDDIKKLYLPASREMTIESFAFENCLMNKTLLSSSILDNAFRNTFNLVCEMKDTALLYKLIEVNKNIEKHPIGFRTTDEILMNYYHKIEDINSYKIHATNYCDDIFKSQIIDSINAKISCDLDRFSIGLKSGISKTQSDSIQNLMFKHSFTYLIMIGMYTDGMYNVIKNFYDKNMDALSMENALRWSEYLSGLNIMGKLPFDLKYLEMQADILYKLRRRNQAVKVMNKLIDLARSEKKDVSHYTRKLEIMSDLQIEKQIVDFDVFKTTIKEAHAGLYNFNSIQSIDSLFNNLEYQISSEQLSLNEQFSLYAEFVAAIKCIHTAVRSKKLSRNLSKLNMLDKLFYYHNDSIYAYSNSKLDFWQYSKGDKIIEINDKPINQIKQELLKFLPSDGRNLTFKERYLEINFFYLTFLHFLPNAKTINVRYIHINDTLQKKITEDDFKKVRIKGVDNAFLRNSKFQFKIDTDKSVGFLTLQEPMQGGFIYRKRIDRVFKDLDKHNIRNLVIDLRGNFGGLNQDHFCEYLIKDTVQSNSLRLHPLHNMTYKNHIVNRFSPQYLIPLYTYRLQHWVLRLKKSKYDPIIVTDTIKPNHMPYKGKVFVLVDGLTVSAAANTATNLKEFANATIVGEETGGGKTYLNSGVFSIRLPNSKIKLILPAVAHIITNTIKDDADGLLPDIHMNYKPNVNSNKNDMEIIYDIILNKINDRVN